MYGISHVKDDPPLNVICYISKLVIDCSQKEGVYKSLWGLTLVKPHTNVFVAYIENLGTSHVKVDPLVICYISKLLSKL